MSFTHTVAWGLWIGGTILIVGSWIRIVPNELGWIGFVAAAIGTCLSYAFPAMSEDRSNAIIECPGCRQCLTVPVDKGALAIRCPKCFHEWDWKPPEAVRR
jgi:LSD1 subclass zinc finger protein